MRQKKDFPLFPGMISVFQYPRDVLLSLAVPQVSLYLLFSGWTELFRATQMISRSCLESLWQAHWSAEKYGIRTQGNLYTVVAVAVRLEPFLTASIVVLPCTLSSRFTSQFPFVHIYFNSNVCWKKIRPLIVGPGRFTHNCCKNHPQNKTDIADFLYLPLATTLWFD